MSSKITIHYNMSAKMLSRILCFKDICYDIALMMTTFCNKVNLKQTLSYAATIITFVIYCIHLALHSNLNNLNFQRN